MVVLVIGKGETLYFKNKKGECLMSSEVAIILASHGNFALEALKSLEMIMGKQTNIEALSLHPGESLSELITKMEVTYNNLDTTNGTIVICDIYGGSPSNAAATLLVEYSDEPIVAFAGLNLNILLEMMSGRKGGFNETLRTVKEAEQHSWIEIKHRKITKEEEVDL